MSNNFFETLTSDNKSDDSSNEYFSSKLKSVPLIEADSPHVSHHGLHSNSNSNMDSETMVSFTNTVLPSSTEGNTRISFDGGMNFFKNPEIKLKLKKG